MSQPENHLYEFGPFRIDLSERQLFRDGEPVSLTPKAFETLLMLVSNRGHIVEKDDLLKEVWKGTFVEEANISRHVWMLRQALGENENDQKYIETVPKRGYRFIANVREVVDGGDQLVVERHSIMHITAEEDDEAAILRREVTPDFEQKLLAAISARQKWLGWRLGLGLVLSVLVIGLGVTLYRNWTPKESKSSAANIALTALPRSIAVLPFKTITTENDNEYLGMGMTDALITRLGNISQIIVRPTSAVRKYSDGEKEPVSVGQELKVESVLEGSIQRSGDRIRVTVQLIRVGDGAQIWGDKFDDKFTNVFAVEDSISERMAAALKLKLTGDEQKKLTKRYTENVEAYQLYLKGRFYWNERTGEALKKSIEYFNQAIEKDPSYALAYAGLADAYILLPFYSGRPQLEVYPKAKAAAKRALELDETLAEAHTSLARVLFNIEGNLPESNKEFQRAIELDPNYATAHQWYGNGNLLTMGRFDEGIAEMKRAQELDPLSLVINTALGNGYFYARRYDQAIEQLRKTIAMDQSFYYAHYSLGLAYEMKGSLPEAMAEYQKARELNDNPYVLALLGHALAASGKRDEALRALDQLKEIARQRYVPAHDFAIVYLGLGDNDHAIQWLERGYQDHPAMTRLKIDPLLDNLRSDPRFADLVRRVGL
jgi:DNA-binding winged helix-turn-helix (wHTH) protein/TolB-like protein/Tfp pilus assembly protein PilF